MRWPLHGYLMVKIANAIIGPEENISRGTLSTLLARLHKDGLVTPAGEGTRPFPSNQSTRVYQITPAGKERFYQLMLEMPQHPGAYSRLFHMKALHLDLLPPEQQRVLTGHYLRYCQDILESKVADIADFSDNPEKRAYAANPHLRETAERLMRLKARQWEQEVEWARQLQEAQIVGEEER